MRVKSARSIRKGASSGQTAASLVENHARKPPSSALIANHASKPALFEVPIRSKVDRCSLCAAKATRLALPISSISPNAYWSSIVENKSRASDSVIHPRSPTCKVLSDADSASSSTALSLRASGGVDVPRPMAALIVFHIPMTEPLYCSAVNHRSLDPQRCRAR